MNKEEFFLENEIEEIKSYFKMGNGWLKIYQNNISGFNSNSVYCYLIEKKYFNKYKENSDSLVQCGNEGKPSIIGDTYNRFSNKGLEPFIYSRYFRTEKKDIKYIDISEDFVLYFNLYEEGENKLNRKFIYTNDWGETEEVLIVEPNFVKIKIKYLKEYITIRDMYFAVFFDFMRLFDTTNTDWDVIYCDNPICMNNYVYQHVMKNFSGETQNWIRGNVFIEPDIEKRYHNDIADKKDKDFVIDVDEDGNIIKKKCGDRMSNTFLITYFKKSVLDKYYNNPNLYKVDNFIIQSKFFNLKIDNNMEDYLPVFLNNLVMLSEREQQHWQEYNIIPSEKMHISSQYYTTMIEGNWNEEPGTADFYFKYKYKSFNEKWKNKFKWDFFKPLNEKDKYILISLHKITSNNEKDFGEQILFIVKLMIDRLNEKNIADGLTLLPNDRGITKLEKFLKSKSIEISEYIEFLKNLQNLRSGLIAHTYSDKNVNCKKAFAYFELRNDNYMDVEEIILMKSIKLLNTLELCFKL